VAGVLRAVSPFNKSKLGSGLKKWAQACGFHRERDSVLIKDLLPHHSNLLDLLHSQHHNGLLSHVTICEYLGALRTFFRRHQQDFSSYVDIPAMLSSMDAAYERAAAGAAAARHVAAVAGSAVEPPAASAIAARLQPRTSAQLTAPAAAQQPAAAVAAAGSSEVSFTQLIQQLGSFTDCISMLFDLAQNTPGTTADSAVAPVLLWHTRPELLQVYREAIDAADATDFSEIDSTLHGLLQLLVRPELDAVLGAGVRRRRLAVVASLLAGLEARLQACSRGGRSTAHRACLS
jgi:hypothetical protein